MTFFVALPFIGGWIGYTYAPEKVVEVERVVILEKESNEEESKLTNESCANDVFEQCKKTLTTEVYYSESLDIGFTYDPYNYSDERSIWIQEVDNKIYSYGNFEIDQMKESNSPIGGITYADIEVFEKDPDISFQQALENRFLSEYDAEDCYVEFFEESEPFFLPELPDYIAAEIVFPPNEEVDGASFNHGDKCVDGYSRTNGKQYFLFNKNAPDKYFFIRIGQDWGGTDGTSLSNDKTGPKYNWTHSIRIFE